MKYCSHCGHEVNDEAEICVNCGCRVSRKSSSDSDTKNTLGLIAKILMIISCVTCGFFLLPLAWCIPMTLAVSRKLQNNEPISVGLKVCTLLFVNTVAGILLLCMGDNQ